eukprot:COSAG05_NODE_1333_length_5152_cov_4.935484_4_plen_69_part_00
MCGLRGMHACLSCVAVRYGPNWQEIMAQEQAMEEAKAAADKAEGAQNPSQSQFHPIQFLALLFLLMVP